MFFCCVVTVLLCAAQGTLKERTIKNLDKYVVKDVSKLAR